MAVITPDTFGPLRREPAAQSRGNYVGVRLQQGVPLVDADWNEFEDIRKFELQAYLKWFVGNGVPESPLDTSGVRRPDGFRITPVGAGIANDITIDAGITGASDGLRNVGRILVEGLDVVIEANVNFRAQPLHASQAGAAAEATRLGLPATATIAEMPLINGTVSIYLDVWERLVTIAEDPSLVHTQLGTESCVRRKREWVVRARAGTNAPQPTDTDFVPGHFYYVLAHVTRSAADPVVRVADIVDRRERRLLTLPATLTEDLFGVAPLAYRRGENRPAIDLRQAINALIRGELPGAPERAIATAPATDFIGRAFVFDGLGNIVAFWRSLRSGGADHIFMSRLSVRSPGTGFVTATPVTTVAPPYREPHAVRTGPDRFFLVYTKGTGGGADIVFRHDSFANLPTSAENPVVNTAGVAETRPFAVVSGDFVVVFFHRDGPGAGWMFRRWRLSTSSWDDPATALPLTFLGAIPSTLHAAVDTAGNVWVAAVDVNTVNVLRMNPSTPTGSPGAFFSTPTGGAGMSNDQPFILCPRASGLAIDAWLFWHRSSPAVFAIPNAGGAWGTGIMLAGGTTNPREPVAVEDSEGTIWLTWAQGTGAGDLALSRLRPSGALLQTRPLITSLDDDGAPFALMEPNDVMWLFWARNAGGVNIDLFFKQVVTKV